MCVLPRTAKRPPKATEGLLLKGRLGLIKAANEVDTE